VDLLAHETAESFLETAEPVLGEDEPRHNLVYGICDTIVRSPEAHPSFHLWTVQEGGETVGAALMTLPFNAVVARPRSDGALEFLARELHADRVELPGVTGALPEASDFAGSWEQVAGVHRRRRTAHGIYAATEIRIPRCTGRMRRASWDDRDLVVDWMKAFVAEALPEDAPVRDLEESVARRLDAESLALWEDGQPVSMAGAGGWTPTGVRIGPVYTPPELRGRGYASALTAELSAELLAGGRKCCFLYTDLANPTSNRIYQAIGYEFVCESAEYAFDA
jgi:predicted GNAT family acetyltransferase